MFITSVEKPDIAIDAKLVAIEKQIQALYKPKVTDVAVKLIYCETCEWMSEKDYLSSDHKHQITLPSTITTIANPQSDDPSADLIWCADCDSWMEEAKYKAHMHTSPPPPKTLGNYLEDDFYGKWGL